MVVIVVDMNREAPADASFSSFVVSWKKKIPSLFIPGYHLLLCPPLFCLSDAPNGLVCLKFSRTPEESTKSQGLIKQNK